jgi:Fic family protein
MRMPERPPDQAQLYERIKHNPKRLIAILSAISGPLINGKYLHWDKLKRHAPPGGWSHHEWWYALKMHRQALLKTVPLSDKAGEPFKYLVTDPMYETLNAIDQGAGGTIRMPQRLREVTNRDTRNQYCVRSLIEEAITSSQLEGATTTRRVAKEMIRTGRRPRDRSEQMIFNNFVTMQRIGELKKLPLSKELVLEIHRLVTEQTLDDPSAAGRLRQSDERIDVVPVVGDRFEVVHVPPESEQLEERMATMCDFANAASRGAFIHPVIRSIVLHFWLAYDHPFVDGNGRTARALFYWSMLHHDYWLFEFVSISPILRKAPAEYSRAFLYTETDDNDLTYFIVYHLKVIDRAIRELQRYIGRKAEELQEVEHELRECMILNHRQRALVSHALRHPHNRYMIESHRRSHNVVYETARNDLHDLRKRGLLEAGKDGRKWYFQPVSDLRDKLSSLS